VIGGEENLKKIGANNVGIIFFHINVGLTILKNVDNIFEMLDEKNC
jgi:hypothetical protein